MLRPLMFAYHIPLDASTNISDPPTDAQLDSAIGTPSDLCDGSTFPIYALDDAGNNTDVWIVGTNGTSWFYLGKMTKAV
jgi:hypothetical protein